eukprot:NODE_38_length_30618_cov_0.377142.p5 type:complete len:392 gc:universal NODE_38_length_30618_cov_0.377142:17613-16438(-)
MQKLFQKQVTVCLSGGIDSAISAFLLKKQGYKVRAIYMKNWPTPTSNDKIPKIKRNFDLGCPFHKDYLYAQNVADFMEIDLKLIDLQKEYWSRVFEPFLCKLQDNQTPNPDIECNSHIKFDELRKHIHTEYMATGHYCRVEDGYLMRGRDIWKDQSYFLCQVKNLNKVIFPLGDLLKLQVKWLAYSIAASNSSSYSELISKKYYSRSSNVFHDLLNKKESMGICFIGKRNFGEFVDNYLLQSHGNIIEIDSGAIIQQHRGTHFYTIGQGIKVPGCSFKLYVIHKSQNTIYVGHCNHKLLYVSKIDASCSHWFRKPTPRMMAKIRHPYKLISCTFHENTIYFDTPVRALTPGQTICLFNGDYVVGSMVIPQNWNASAVEKYKNRNNKSPMIL